MPGIKRGQCECVIISLNGLGNRGLEKLGNLPEVHQNSLKVKGLMTNFFALGTPESLAHGIAVNHLWKEVG